MIDAVKSLCQITENSSNIQFSTICQSEGSIFSRHPFTETILFCDQYVLSMQLMA
jgi:hypothetical protein